MYFLYCSPFYLKRGILPKKKRTKLVGVNPFQPKSWLEISSIPFYPQRILLCKCAWHLWCRLNRRHFICRMLKHERWKSTMAKNRPSQNVSKIELQIFAGSLFLLISPSTWNESAVLRHKLSSFCWTFVRLSDAERSQLYYYTPWKFQRMETKDDGAWKGHSGLESSTTSGIHYSKKGLPPFVFDSQRVGDIRFFSWKTRGQIQIRKKIWPNRWISVEKKHWHFMSKPPEKRENNYCTPSHLDCSATLD